MHVLASLLALHLTSPPCLQADFLDGDMGSSNMKGFVMALQKKGMVHHSILVEQVRDAFRERELISRLCLFTRETCYVFLSF